MGPYKHKQRTEVGTFIIIHPGHDCLGVHLKRINIRNSKKYILAKKGTQIWTKTTFIRLSDLKRKIWTSLLRSENVNFPRHKLWVCLQSIIWFEDYLYTVENLNHFEEILHFHIGTSIRHACTYTLKFYWPLYYLKGFYLL